MADPYKIIDGLKCYAPELAYENTDYPSEYFERLYLAEEENFWFRSRNKVILSLVSKYLADKGSSKCFLEIGCGTGYVLKGLSKFSDLQLKGAEIHVEGLKYAQRRLPRAEFIQLDATRMPFENEFEAVGAFDTLEHIEKDTLVMKNVYSALRPNGVFFITVPQYQWMWSYIDDMAFHKRRYARNELAQKLHAAGFSIDYIGSFVCFIFPLMVISRLMKKKSASEKSKPDHLESEISIHPFLNSIFKKIMLLDEFFIRNGFHLPFGGSLIVVARKESPKQKND